MAKINSFTGFTRYGITGNDSPSVNPHQYITSSSSTSSPACRIPLIIIITTSYTNPNHPSNMSCSRWIHVMVINVKSACVTKNNYSGCLVLSSTSMLQLGKFEETVAGHIYDGQHLCAAVCRNLFGDLFGRTCPIKSN